MRLQISRLHTHTHNITCVLVVGVQGGALHDLRVALHDAAAPLDIMGTVGSQVRRVEAKVPHRPQNPT